LTRKRGSSAIARIEVPDEVFAEGRLDYAVFVMASTIAVALLMTVLLVFGVSLIGDLSAPSQRFLDMNPYWYLAISLMTLVPVLLILAAQSFFPTGRGKRMALVDRVRRDDYESGNCCRLFYHFAHTAHAIDH